MKLVRIKVSNIVRVPDGTYELVHPSTGYPAELVVVSGDPRSGKTALLETIVAAKEGVAGYGAPLELATLLRRGATSGAVEATWWFSPEEVDRADLQEPVARTSCHLRAGAPAVTHCDPEVARVLARYESDPEIGKLAYFADNRTLAEDNPQRFFRSAFESREPSLALSRSIEKHSFLTGLLADLAQEHGLAASKAASEAGLTLRSQLPDPLEPLRTALATLMPDLRLLGVSHRGELPVVLFEGRDGAERELRSLSASEQQAVLLASGFWHAGLNHSVVLIDEPELHIQAEEQRAWLRGLRALGTSNQLIVATSSPEITTSGADVSIRLSRRGAAVAAG